LPEIIQPKNSEIHRGGADDGFAPVLQNALFPAILKVLSATLTLGLLQACPSRNVGNIMDRQPALISRE
jgi:hypothetical protein